MAEISWAEGPRTALVCIDAWERGVPVGRLYTPRFPQGIESYGLTHFLQEMEATLDTLELPTAFSGLRSFGIGGMPAAVYLGRRGFPQRCRAGSGSASAPERRPGNKTGKGRSGAGG